MDGKSLHFVEIASHFVVVVGKFLAGEEGRPVEVVTLLVEERAADHLVLEGRPEVDDNHLWGERLVVHLVQEGRPEADGDGDHQL